MAELAQEAVTKEGLLIFEAIKRVKESFFTKDVLMERLLGHVMKDDDLKVDLFRFVDVLPTLETNEQILSHIEEYLIKPGRKLPFFINAGLKAASLSLTKNIAAQTIKNSVIDFSQKFIAGSTILDAKDSLEIYIIKAFPLPSIF